MNVATMSLSALTCLVGFTATAAEPTHSPLEARSQTQRTLDLKAPLITNIFTAQQIDMVLAQTGDPELEHVEVEASRINDVPFTDRSASGTEAALREVTRWFAPYPQTFAAQVNSPPDFTDSYRPVPVAMVWYHPNFPAPVSLR